MMATQCGRAESLSGDDQADCSFFMAAATRATNAMSMMKRFMRGRIVPRSSATTLRDGGVRVPGGLRRLQSGWDE